MSNDNSDRRTVALLRVEGRALERLGTLRGSVVELLAFLDRLPLHQAAPRLDAGNLIPLDRVRRRLEDSK